MGSQTGSGGDAKATGGLSQGDGDIVDRAYVGTKGKKPVVDESTEGKSAPPVGNPDRRMIIMNQSAEEVDAEEEYDFGQDEEVVQMQEVWFVVARFYTGQDFNAWTVFTEFSHKAWGRQDTVPFRSIGENHFIVNFDSEKLWRRVVEGGPWKFNGDAMIFVPYDGVRKASEIVIESIHMWVRIYDIPATMMTDGFARALGSKIGKVIEVGVVHNDYKRVKIDFPLDKPVMRVVQQKVKGHGLLEFVVGNENIPYFCFFGGYIGHAQRECPEDGVKFGDVRFGQHLRCFPQKRVLVRRAPKPALVPSAKWGLNFSGDQRKKVMSEGYSSNASLRGGTTREAIFPECHVLPRVPKIGHLGKTIFPECCTRGRIALGEERHTKKKSCI
jgi:hypothetical protein